VVEDAHHFITIYAASVSGGKEIIMKIAVSNFEYENMFQTNLSKAGIQAENAARSGADMIIFHEWFLGVNPVGPIPNQVTDALCRMARENKIMVISGGIRYTDETGKILVGSLIIDKDGKIVGIQPKLHLYDNEKKWIAPGEVISPFKTEHGNIVILSGLDGIEAVHVSEVLNKIEDNIELIIFQCTEFTKEASIKLSDLALNISSKKQCYTIVAGLHGFFCEQKFLGESIVYQNGTILSKNKDDEVVLSFEADECNLEYEVVDAHVHIIFRETGEVNLDPKVQLLIEKSIDVPVKNSIVNYMNRAGIDKSVIFDWSGSLEGDFSVTNDKVIELSRYSDKFIGFGVPSPTDQSIVSMLYDKGVRGLKVNPSLQVFYPNSDEFISVCREANKYNLPILIHTGPESAGKLKYDLPLLIDDIAVEIPDLKIMLAHIGVRGFTSEQAIMVAEKNSNVFVETSWASTELVKEAIMKLGSEKVIFGSDFPSRNPIIELQKIKDLLTSNFISESDYRKITGYNISHLIRKSST